MSLDIKKQVLEPKVFALLLRYQNPPATMLHVGIYFSLEDAFNGAKAKLFENIGSTDAIGLDLEMWAEMTAREALGQLLSSEVLTSKIIRPTVQKTDDQSPFLTVGGMVRNVDTVVPIDVPEPVLSEKNIIMKRLIDAGDVVAVARDTELTENEKQFIIDSIIKNK